MIGSYDTHPLTDSWHHFSLPFSQFLPATAADGVGPGCMEVSYATTLAEMRNATFDGLKAARQWYYQTCNEFGYFQTSASPLSHRAQPFAAFETITLDSYLALCRELFHDVRAVPVDWTNTYYGEVRGARYLRTADPSRGRCLS